MENFHFLAIVAVFHDKSDGGVKLQFYGEGRCQIKTFSLLALRPCSAIFRFF